MEPIPETVKDTVYIIKENVQIYKDIIENIHSTYSNIFLGIGIIFTILLAFSILWNLNLAKRQIRKEAKKLLEKETSNLITDQEKKFDRELMDMKAQNYYLSASVSFGNQLYGHSLYYALKSLEKNIKLKNELQVKKVLDGITRILKRMPDNQNEVKNRFSDIPEENRKRHKVCIEITNEIPETYSSVKAAIRSKITATYKNRN